MKLDPSQCDCLLVYGGSFDPPHRAHMALPLIAADYVEAEGVLYVPAGQPPHKENHRITEARHRLAMLRLALGECDDAAICTWELDRPGPSYTWQTLEHLRQRYGEGIDLRLLIGADMAAIFYTWQRPDRILELARPSVMLRDDWDVDSLLQRLPPDQRDRWLQWIVPVPRIEVSSTDVREALQQGRYDDARVLDALPPAVQHYIREHGLYRGSGNATPDAARA